MDILFIITLYFTSIISLSADTSEEMIRKVDKKKLDLNITKDDENITVQFKSKEYIPAAGIWTSDIFTINDNAFLIEDTGFFEWLKENITDNFALSRFLNTIDSRTFEHKADKKAFYKKADNLELALVIFKIEDFRILATEYLETLKSKSTYSSSGNYDAEKEFEIKIQKMQVVYNLRYNNTANEIPSDLNDYELYILKSSRISDSFETLVLLKRCAFDVIVGAVLTFTIFGILVFAGRYSLSKYF